MTAQIFTPKARNGRADSFARCTKCRDEFKNPWESNRYATWAEANAAADAHNSENH